METMENLRIKKPAEMSKKRKEFEMTEKWKQLAKMSRITLMLVAE